MDTTSCTQRWILYLAWLKSTPDTQEDHRAIYSAHLRDCPACRQTLDADAAGPAMPPFDEVMSEAVK